jgi:hypothetical protein
MAPTLFCMLGIPLRGQATSYMFPATPGTVSLADATPTGAAASRGAALREARP